MTNLSPLTNRKPRLTRDQKKALDAYNYALRQEYCYHLGSVFVTPAGQRENEAKTLIAYQICVSLGLTYKHGL